MIISNKYFYYGVFFSLFFNEIVAESKISLKSKISNIVQDFPSHKDLRVYLISLERIINFSYDHRDDLNINFGFGLFLVNVNLKPFTINYYLSRPLRNYLKRLLIKNDNILEYFNNKGHVENNSDYARKISSFFGNYTVWTKWVKKLHLELPHDLQTKQNQMFSNWRAYVKNVDNVDKWKPNPKKSDFCLASLAETSQNNIGPQKCKIRNECYKILISGTNFGYGLTHRLLLLLLARFSRGCTVFSDEQDQVLRNSFCKMIYSEAEYIAQHECGHVDLMLEQIALCALDGHAEFIHRSWLSQLLRYQTPHGCFDQSPPNQPTFQSQDPFKISADINWKHDIMNGTCNRHVTAVAAASIAAAIRLILENL